MWVNESLMNKKDFVLQMVKINGEMIELTYPDLKKDMAVATAAAVQNINALQFVDPMIRNIVEKAVLEQEAILE